MSEAPLCPRNAIQRSGLNVLLTDLVRNRQRLIKELEGLISISTAQVQIAESHQDTCLASALLRVARQSQCPIVIRDCLRNLPGILIRFSDVLERQCLADPVPRMLVKRQRLRISSERLIYLAL